VLNQDQEGISRKVIFQVFPDSLSVVQENARMAEIFGKL